MHDEPRIERRREALRTLNALPADRKRTAWRMILTVLASFGIVAASFAGLAAYWVLSAPNQNWTLLKFWFGATVLFSLVGVTFTSWRLSKTLGLPLEAPSTELPPQL